MNTIEFINNEFNPSAAAKIEKAIAHFGDHIILMSIPLVGHPSWISASRVIFSVNASCDGLDWEGIFDVTFDVISEKFFTDRGETTIEAVMDRLHGKEEVA